jgi:hypothetical protein
MHGWRRDPDPWRLCLDPVLRWRGSRSSIGEHVGVVAREWLAVAMETGSPMGLEMGSPVGSKFFYVFFNLLTEAGRATVSVRSRLTVTFDPRRLQKPPR